MTQAIEIFQSLWAMDLRRPDGFEWSLEQKFDKIAAAGFDGVDIVYGDYGVEQLQSQLARHALACTITAFPNSVEALAPAIDMAVALKARHLNVIGKVYPFSIDEGADFVRGWMALAASASLPLTIETHRDCLTTDLHYTLQLMDAVPEMLLCADLSHFVVGREFSWPITELVESQVRSVLDRSHAIQGRVASREQIQVQISFPHHREWLELFAGWWRYGIDQWRMRNSDGAVLNFLCELGPCEYAMTGADGYELSDRWCEALALKKLVGDLWLESA